MNTSPRLFAPLSSRYPAVRPIVYLWLGLFPALTATLPGAVKDSEIVAVSSHVSEDYARTKLEDGTFSPETYAFGEGGPWNAPMRDPSFDGIKFMDAARVISRPLAAQNYLPTRDPKKTKLLIMVYWGMTACPANPSSSMAYQALQGQQPILAMKNIAPPAAGVSRGAAGLNQMGKGLDSVQDGSLSARDFAITMINTQNAARDMANAQNAGILGYDTDMRRTEGLGISAMRNRRLSLIEDLEDNRYFVVLMAYDFQLMWKEKKRKLLWDARFSIRERGNEFDKQLEAMAQAASKYFGQASDGLRRREFPKGEVRLGELEILSDVPATK